MTAARTCEQCGSDFLRPRTLGRAVWLKRRFCGNECYVKSRRLRSPKSTCGTCGQRIRSRDASSSKFCSRACWRNRSRPGIAERFWSKVDKNGPVPAHAPELGPCWVWTAARDNHGYGQLNVFVGGKSRPVKAHRVAWFLAHGSYPVPCGLHKCDGGGIGCVRIGHLYEGTPADNARDRVERGGVVMPNLRGEDHGRSKTTEAGVREMRRRHAEGESLKCLALAFGMSSDNVSLIVRRKAWKHVS